MSKNTADIGTSLVVHWLNSYCCKRRRSGKLRPYMPCGEGKTLKKKNQKTDTSYVKVATTGISPSTSLIKEMKIVLQHRHSPSRTAGMKDSATSGRNETVVPLGKWLRIC